MSGSGRVQPEGLVPSPGTKRLCVLFALVAFSLGLWSVNISAVLKAYGLGSIIPYVFGCNAIAAFLSPLVVGAFADQRFAPEKVFRFLGIGAALFISLLFYSVEIGMPSSVVLGFALVHSIFSVPTFGLMTSIVMARLRRPEDEFGKIRAWATLGWMVGGLTVSFVLHADQNVVSGYAAGVAWIATVLFSLWLPSTRGFSARKFRSTREMFGLDALTLFRNKNHRAVFLTAAMMNLVLAAFYPYTVLHLASVGVEHPTAVMSLGQITELIAMVILARLILRHSFKALFLMGISFAVVRYALFILGTPLYLGIGVFLHGLCFTLFYITAQIYLERQVDPQMRARAQALLTLMMSGVGNLLGYLICGWWRQYTSFWDPEGWSYFWAGLLTVTLLVMMFFSRNYSDKALEK